LENRKIASGIPNCSTRCRLVVVLNPWPLYARKRPATPAEKKGAPKAVFMF